MAILFDFANQTLPGGATPLGTEEKSILAKDPFAGFEPADEFADFEEAPDEFSAFQQADDLDLRDVDALDKDREKFDPKAYFSQNPDVAKEPKKLQKLLEVYRRRRKEGLKASEVAKSVVKETPGLIGGIAKGARDLAARTLDVTLQPVANIALGAITGELSDPQRRKAFKEEGRKSIKKAFGEIGAGSEAAAAGIADIGRQGVRKFSKVPDDDQELLQQLSDDVEFQKQAATILKGRGEAEKALGLDADTLKAEGITLDEKAIENLSLVDPITLVATGGIFRAVGLGGKVLGTAATRVGADKLVSKLGNLATKAAGKTVKGVGATVQAGGRAGKSLAEITPAKTIGAAVGVGQTGTFAGAAVGAGAGETVQKAAVKTAEAVAASGAKVKQFGQQIIGEVPKSAGLQRVQDILNNQVTRGAAKGAAAGTVGAAPLAAAVDDDKAAGALLGAGIALGAGGGALIGAKQAVASKISKVHFDRNAAPVPNVDSPGYGLDANLDTAHEANVKTLSQNEQANINTFREALRDVGGEIYSLDPDNFKQRILENMERAKGSPLTAPELAAGDTLAKTSAFFDAAVPDAQGNVRRVVFLNGDSTGLLHDSGHLFQSILSPDRQTELRNSVTEFYKPEEIAQFKADYESRLGRTVTPDYILDEIIAENYNALFNNVPLKDLTAPKGFLQKLGQQSLDVAEALGINLKAGAITPDLQISPSYRLRSLLESGAREVLQHAEAAKGTGPRVVGPAEIVPEGPRELIPGEVELAPREVAPVAPVAVPEALKSISTKPVEIPVVAPKPTPNIRATRKQQNDFAAKRAEVTNVEPAKSAAAKNTDPNAMAQVEAISGHMDAGNPVLEIEHRGAIATGTPDAPSGRTARRSEQEADYIAEGMGAAPATVRNKYQKTVVPVRWEIKGSEPQLIGMSLDKVIANVHRAVKDAVSVKRGDLIPYEQAEGKLTETGWNQAVSDVQAYAENHANGFRGDGQKLTRPTEDVGLSIPAENPDFRPNILTEDRMNFVNMVMGLAPPKTARITGKATPGNIKGQTLAEINKRVPETPAKIAPGDIAKQEFKGFPGRSVKETNPLRNKLAEAGAPIRELIEVTERINAGDIQSVKPRPDIQFRAPVTDIIRGGFLPGKETIAELGAEVQKMSGEEWRSFTESSGTALTPEAYKLGLGLKDRADLARLKELWDAFTETGRAARKAGDYQKAMVDGTKGQFFREALEAATDTGSAAGKDYGWRRFFPEGKPPFAENLGKMQFLPADRFSNAADPIEFASIRTPKGKVFTGSWHGEALMSIMDEIGRGTLNEEVPKSFIEGERGDWGTDGFTTRSGKFLNRAEALEHARKIKQLEEPVKANSFAREGILESGELKFLPKTEAGKKLAKEELVFEIMGRNVTVKKDDVLIGELQPRRP